MVKKKYKKLTNAEKKENKEMREHLRNEGLLPPVKKKLNRRKFVADTVKEYNQEKEYGYADILYLHQAICWMTAGIDVKICPVSPEVVGVAKAMKIAIEIKNFHEKLRKEGKKEYGIMEEYEIAKKIMDL